MATSHSAFLGGVPENYDRYLGPMFFEPYGADIVERVVPLAPSDVLEIACGTGIVTKRLAEKLPSTSRITATDLNEAMLAIARQKLGDNTQVDFAVADACALPMNDGDFDAIICQFGVMFFPDKAKAFAEFARVLRPDGHLLFNVWDSLAYNDGPRTADAAVRECFPIDSPSFYDTPFGFHDRPHIVGMLEQAGFGSVSWTEVARVVESRAAADAASGLLDGSPVSAEIVTRDPAALPRLRDTVTASLRDQFGDKPMRCQARAVVFQARKPA